MLPAVQWAHHLREQLIEARTWRRDRRRSVPSSTTSRSPTPPRRPASRRVRSQPCVASCAGCARSRLRAPTSSRRARSGLLLWHRARPRRQSSGGEIALQLHVQSDDRIRNLSSHPGHHPRADVAHALALRYRSPTPERTHEPVPPVTHTRRSDIGEDPRRRTPRVPRQRRDHDDVEGVPPGRPRGLRDG